MNDEYVDVSEFDGAMREAEVVDFERVPDGSYQAMVHTVQFKWLKSKDSRASKIFEWVFKVVNGPMRGARIWKTALLRDDLLKYLKTDAWKCGVKIQTASELQQRLSELLDVLVELKVETKTIEGKERQNVYIQRQITTDDAPASRPARNDEPPPPTDDDIPF